MKVEECTARSLTPTRPRGDSTRRATTMSRDRARVDAARAATETREDAARVVAELLASASRRRRGASVKARTLARDVRWKRATHAVTCETIKSARVIRALFADVGGALGTLATMNSNGTETRGNDADDDAWTRRGEAYVRAYETLFGNGKHLHRWRGGVGCETVRANEQALRDALERAKTREGAATASALVAKMSSRSTSVARYSRTARVNTLKMTVEEAMRAFREDGYECAIDGLVDTLLVFPAGTDLHAHEMVTKGAVVLQGRASCLPAVALAPERGWACVDGCAAPGNKTTQLAAMVGREGGVHAFDADARRLKRLKENAAKTGSQGIIRAKCQDFLTVDPENDAYASVRALLLDPSCSGSGTEVNRGDIMLRDALADEDDDSEVDAHDERVEKLAVFQKSVLTHAFKFPEVQRISYSTCSVHVEENEQVVRDVLAAAKERGFRLTRALPKWHRRGYVIDGLSESDARCLIRADPVEDDMEGFFVAIFERDVELTRSKGLNLPPANPNASLADATKSKKKRPTIDAANARPVYAASSKKKSKGGKPTPLFR